VRGIPADLDAGLSTNEVTLAVAPEVLDVDAVRNAGTVTVTVDFKPQIAERQHVLLLLSDQVLEPEAFAEGASTLEFKSKTLAARDYLVRLRVDGVDSPLVDRSVSPPVYDPTQKVTVP
jgi:hypothetical protein